MPAEIRQILSSSVVAILIFAIPAVAVARPTVTGVRMGVHPEATRFVLDLTEGVEFKTFTLPNPYRLVIDLPEVYWRVPSGALASGAGIVQKFRFGLFKPGTFRVVLDLVAPAKVERAFTLLPSADFGYRLVIDVAEVSVASFRPTVPPRSILSKKRRGQAPKPKLVRPKGSKRVVVIDAGHGGVDPGAVSVGGDYEKHIVLSAALELERQLKATGSYEVVMTRRRDIFRSLGNRVNLARSAGADLFISLHADAIGNKNVSGATVYTLSEKASDREAAKLAAKENKADIIAGVDLTAADYDEDVANILIDLTQRETTNFSREFANEFLIPELKKRTKMLRKSHRFAGFKVLKSPDVPSVLIEMGYLSNRDDESRLRDPAYRSELMSAIVRAVESYFTHLPSMGRT
jgi:N-acetylmuramoyl-L-alanine amidase